MKEFQTIITIKDSHGDKHSIVIRGEVASHKNCTASHQSLLGEMVMWHSAIHYSWPKREGIVIKKEQRIWDYSMPIGQRAVKI